MRRLIMSVCAGYSDGKFPAGLILRGIMDWDSRNWASTFRCEPPRLACPASSATRFECGLCERICRAFPLEHVLQNDNDDVSNYTGTGCPSFSKRLSIVASRPGGVKAIQKLALPAAFARQRASMSICIPVDADGMLCPVIHFRDTMRWDDVEAALHFIDASEIGYSKLIKWIQPPLTGLEGGTNDGLGNVLITRSAFNKLKQLGFYLVATDFRAIFDNGNCMEE